LPIVRDEFIAVPGDYKKIVLKSDPEFKAYSDYLRRQAKELLGLDKVFVCPGKCGDCTGSGHACGLKQVKIPIVIAAH
jgi:hypothetical protein